MNSNRNNLIYSIPDIQIALKISLSIKSFCYLSNQLFNKKKPDTFKI